MSPVAGAAEDPRRLTNLAEVIAADEVLYVGLDSLSDAMVGSAIGSILIADLAAVAGDRYNHQGRPRPVNVFIDESAELVNDPFIQLERLALGLGAGDPSDAARSTRPQANAMAAINAQQAAKKAGVPDRERFAAFFEALMGALAASEHPVPAQAMTANQRRILGGRLRAVLPAPGRGLEHPPGAQDA